MSIVQRLGSLPYSPHTRQRSASEGFTVPGVHTNTLNSFSPATLATIQSLLSLQDVQTMAGSAGPTALAVTEPDAKAKTNSISRSGTEIRSGAGDGFLVATYNRYIGHSTGSGQCVALVQSASPSVGSTHTWTCGEAVQGNTNLRPGTAIATFEASGHYANATDGNSHAAIYLGQNERGVQVLDQWSGNPAAVRTIPWVNSGNTAANTGSAFHVVRSAKLLSF